MRLICPNCDAQYEVDDAAIPAGGRDVQCSSCGHGWFQAHPEVEAERAAESALHDAPDQGAPVAAVEDIAAQIAQDAPVADPAEKTVIAVQDIVPAPDSTEDSAAASVVQDAPEDGASEDEAFKDDDTEVAASEAEAPEAEASKAEAPTEKAEATKEEAPDDDTPDDGPPQMVAQTVDADEDEAALQSRKVDEAVLAVLREEAEREMIARRLDAQAAVETQADLGIDNVGLSLPPTAARHIALLKGEDPDIEPETKRELSRREMLPDIEEINSSLRPGDVAVDDDGETFEIVQRPAPRSGFRSGFVLMLVLAIAVVALYVMAPRIAEQIPGAKPTLDSYVAAVDLGRAWLDQATRSLISGLQGLASGDEAAP